MCWLRVHIWAFLCRHHTHGLCSVHSLMSLHAAELPAWPATADHRSHGIVCLALWKSVSISFVCLSMLRSHTQHSGSRAQLAEPVRAAGICTVMNKQTPSLQALSLSLPPDTVVKPCHYYTGFYGYNILFNIHVPPLWRHKCDATDCIQYNRVQYALSFCTDRLRF